MKDYNEMAESVFERRDRYAAERSRRVKKTTAGLSCLCLVALLGAGVWRAGILSGYTAAPEGETAADPIKAETEAILPSGAAVKEFSMSTGEPGKETRHAAVEDLSNDKEENPPGAPTVSADVPVPDVPYSTGALTAYEAVWGGSYMDEAGRWVIWLTENTQENQKQVFERNPDLLESNTIFKTADYSLDYLTDLMAQISKAMGSEELSFVTTAALREEMNRVEVTMTTGDADSVAKVLTFDTIGGAIVIKYAPDVLIPEDLQIIK